MQTADFVVIRERAGITLRRLPPGSTQKRFGDELLTEGFP